MSQGRIAAIVIVALLHALLGYAFITGLAYNVVKKVAKDLKTFDVTEEPPPPEEKPPPPPPEQTVQPPPVVTPPPIVRTNTAPPQVIQTVNVAPPPQIHIEAPPAPPPAPAPKVEAVAATPRGRPQSWVTDEDYPSSALRAEAQGTTGFRLTVGADGKATDCNVTSSSGNAALDDTTCKLLLRRARFTPAKDTGGNAVSGSYASRITWRIPEN